MVFTGRSGDEKDGGTRFCVDYHRLNMRPSKTPIPCPEWTICWPSNNGSPPWIWRAAIGRCHCHRKQGARWLRDTFRAVSVKLMPFGLCNAPATFERLMDRVLQGLRWSRCLVYLDDIISCRSTFGDTLDNLTLIFERLRSYGLQLKSTKCHLFQSSVQFLGHTVQITFIFIDFHVCDFAFAFKTQNAPCVSRFKRVLFSDRFQFAF